METRTLPSHPPTPQEGKALEPLDQAWDGLILCEMAKLDVRIGPPSQTPGATSPTLVPNQNWLGFFPLVGHALSVSHRKSVHRQVLCWRLGNCRKGRAGGRAGQSWSELEGMSHAGSRHKCMESTWNCACLDDPSQRLPPPPPPPSFSLLPLFLFPPPPPPLHPPPILLPSSFSPSSSPLLSF